ncbi:MAG: flagellar hook-basal body complex protein [Phycisphaerales bacterium]|nr:flagellar hook-basal body complex protein [Phycisphaerales bacterium]
MASTTALFTALSGLNAHARQLDLIGNNIANVNTTGYKSTRMHFGSMFSRTFGIGSKPADTTGGTNPVQIGLGVGIAGTQRNFAGGALSTTGVATDVALEGDGFFIVNSGGTRYFTRSGAFQLNAQNDLVNIDGARVMGYAVDAGFNVVEGNLTALNIPVGSLTLAQATENVTMQGNLNASGSVPTSGSVHTFSTMYTDLAGTVPIDASTDLTSDDVYMDDGTGTIVQVFDAASAKTVTVSGIEKGGKDLGTKSFAFSATAVAGTDDFGTTMQDYMDFLDAYLGLDSTSVSGENLGGSVAISAGALVITGNEGTTQDLNIENADMAASGAGSLVSLPFVPTKSATADGEAARTSLVVYDSLGTPLTVDLSFVLQSTTASGGTTWEWIAESNDIDALDRIAGIGVVEFDNKGAFVSATNESFTVARQNGAVDPLSVSIAFDSGTESITALTDTGSAVAAVFQDGSPIGTLASFAISGDGTISGAFSNGLSRTVGQLAVAGFSNVRGLVDVGNGLYEAGPNSGDAIVTTALRFGTGRIVGGALELSNVDLSQEFISMILTSTGYSASSRVIQTTDQLMQQLLALAR